MQNSRVVCITGTGSYLPERVVTNFDLEKTLDTSDEWIRTRTGIAERRIAGENELSSDMGAAAGISAIKNAGLSVEDIDVIICASISPDVPFPSTACFIQDKIGAKNAFCFDLVGACSGFLYAMEVAEGLLLGNRHKTALVIGSEKMSYFMDWNDRSTCVLFGDGAGAIVMQSLESGPGVSRGILSSVLGGDGSFADLLITHGGGCKEPASIQMLEAKRQYIQMGGNTVYKHAVRCMSEASLQVLDKAGLTMDDIACIIPHQANLRIITAIAEKVGVSMDKMYVNIDKVGNTTAASIPLALDEAMKRGRLKKGDKVIFVVFGAGFTWGASVVEI